MLERNHWIAGVLLVGLLAISPSGQATEQEKNELEQPAATDSLVAESAAEAAEQAIKSLRDETRLELDIRLLNPTSVGQANDS